MGDANDNKVWIIGGIAIVLLLFLLCTCCVGSVLFANWWVDTPSGPSPPFPTPWPPEETPTQGSTLTPPETITVTTTPLPEAAHETLEALQAAEVPVADLHELGIRFLGVSPETPRLAATTPADYPVGTVRRFFVSDVDKDEQFEIDAELIYKTEHVYMWVEQGRRINERRVREAAELFEEHTYPITREFFGSEWKPGVDSDPRISILHAGKLGRTVAGYFSSPDQYVRAVREDSNEMEMFYINIDNVEIGSPFYNGVLAHEFQHMIHWYNDRNEETWLNEGCSELAMALNERSSPGDYIVGGSDISYLYAPDTQLTTWPEGTAGDASAHYGAAYLFMRYFLERFGDEATQALVAHPENGMESVDRVLQDELGLDFTHKELFADWVLSNLINDPTLAEGQYGYAELYLYDPRIDISYGSGDYPAVRQTTVSQYGVDYVELSGGVDVTFAFTGSTQVGLLNTEAYSGKHLWWSNRADESNTTLTRRIDLRSAREAEIRFWTWYEIEKDWDYAYLVVGTTGGGSLPADLTSPEIQWTILDDASLGCIDTNPNGNSFGCGFTGSSRGWDQREADLTPYVGQEIAVRFEYITDAAVNGPGFALDDIELVVDGNTLFFDDVEEGEEAWIARGFVRHANVLPQEWVVQLVRFGSETHIERLLLADGGSGRWELPLSEGIDRAVIAISALAPVTTEKAPYTFSLAVTE